MTLCVSWRFYIRKARHFANSKTICDTFIYKNPALLRYAIFHWIFEICGVGGHLFIKKTMYFAWHFYIEKQCTLPYIAIYKSSTRVFVAIEAIKTKMTFFLKTPILYCPNGNKNEQGLNTRPLLPSFSVCWLFKDHIPIDHEIT